MDMSGQRFPGAERFYTLQQVADHLQMSYKTLWRHVKAGRIAHHRFGSSIRLSQTQLDNLIAKSRVSATEEPIDLTKLVPSRRSSA